VWDLSNFILHTQLLINMKKENTTTRERKLRKKKYIGKLPSIIPHQTGTLSRNIKKYLKQL
jgi:hypothetical protein